MMENAQSNGSVLGNDEIIAIVKDHKLLDSWAKKRFPMGYVSEEDEDSNEKNWTVDQAVYALAWEFFIGCHPTNEPDWEESDYGQLYRDAATEIIAYYEDLDKDGNLKCINNSKLGQSLKSTAKNLMKVYSLEALQGPNRLCYWKDFLPSRAKMLALRMVDPNGDCDGLIYGALALVGRCDLGCVPTYQPPQLASSVLPLGQLSTQTKAQPASNKGFEANNITIQTALPETKDNIIQGYRVSLDDEIRVEREKRVALENDLAELKATVHQLQLERDLSSSNQIEVDNGKERIPKRRRLSNDPFHLSEEYTTESPNAAECSGITGPAAHFSMEETIDSNGCDSDRTIPSKFEYEF
ncbi:hypothetical protein HJFPF1_01273 [Paramyrothecium foliicola]|nr:hypothetical protein HJFPF1_01273 [Paramyrothecium foliicola]